MGFQPVGVKEFIKLEDTPDSYAGQDGKYTKVKATEDALEFGPAIEGVKVRKNSRMPIIGTRPQLNFKEGAAIGLNIADNPPDDEIDITINAKYPTRYKLLLPDNVALPTANPAELVTVDGANFAYKTLDFDPATEESANWEDFLTPDYRSENIVADIYWTSAGAGDVKFGFSVLGREKDEAWDAALGVERTVVQTNAGAGKMNRARITTFPPGWAPGDVLLFKLARKAADVLDTLNADARVLKVVVQYTGEFAQAFYPLVEPVELTVAALDAWTDIDVSAYVPAGATGVIVYVRNTSSAAEDFGLRKKGSTDNRILIMGPFSHEWAMIGVDENRVFQVYFDDADQDIFIVGYTGTGVVFFDNAINKSLVGVGAYANIDCSAECPGAIGLIIEINNASWDYSLRKNGSTDDRYEMNSAHPWAIIGCDAGQIAQGKIANLGTDFFIVGYVYQGAVFKLNSDNVSVVPTGDWQEIDLAAEAPSAIMVFIENYYTGGWVDSGYRKKGSSEEFYATSNIQHYWAIVACDAHQRIEAKYHLGGTVQAHLVGYATWAGA